METIGPTLPIPLSKRLRESLRSAVPLFIILSIAGLLRLYALDLIDVRFDEASAPQFALSIVNGNWLAVAPFSGSIANHPPVFLYVLAIPYLFTRDLLVVAAFRALLDVAAIALLWFLCKRHFSYGVAVLACLFFAIAPWSIQLSRKLSIEEIPLFTVLLLFGLLELVNRKNAWGWIMSGWGLALSVGAHLTALFLAPVALVAWIITFKRNQAAKMLLGAAPLVLLIALYFLYDAGHDLNNIKALLATSREASQASLDSLKFALWISGGYHLSDLTAGAYTSWLAQLPFNAEWIDIVQISVLAIGFVTVVFRLSRSIMQQDWAVTRLYICLVLWALFPVVLQISHSHPVQIHYVTPLYPIPFILMALPVSAVIEHYQARPKEIQRVIPMLGAGITIGCIVIWQVITTFRFSDFVEQYDTSFGGYGLPVRAALHATARARAALCNGISCTQRNAPDDVIIVAPGGDPLVNEQATILNVLLAGVPHRFVNSDAGIIIPPSAAQYIFAPGTDKALEKLLSNIEAGNIETHTYRVREMYPLAYTYVKTAEPLTRQYLDVPVARWNNGTELVGYRSMTSDRLHLDVLLRVIANPPSGADYHWYNHVLVNDNKVAQLDGGGIAPANWRVGDVIIQWFDIPLPVPAPSLPYDVRIGSYQYPSIETVPVTLADGNVTDGINLSIK